jgi:hypothetical protein
VIPFIDDEECRVPSRQEVALAYERSLLGSINGDTAGDVRMREAKGTKKANGVPPAGTAQYCKQLTVDRGVAECERGSGGSGGSGVSDGCYTS